MQTIPVVGTTVEFVKLDWDQITLALSIGNDAAEIRIHSSDVLTFAGTQLQVDPLKNRIGANELWELYGTTVVRAEWSEVFD